jgi:hypothetical protein
MTHVQKRFLCKNETITENGETWPWLTSFYNIIKGNETISYIWVMSHYSMQAWASCPQFQLNFRTMAAWRLTCFGYPVGGRNENPRRSETRPTVECDIVGAWVWGRGGTGERPWLIVSIWLKNYVWQNNVWILNQLSHAIFARCSAKSSSILSLL